MQLVVLGLNHRSAAVEVRERFSFDKDEVVAALNRLYEFDCISECVILSTCNRTEIYAALEGVEFPKDYMLAVLKDLKGADHIDADAFFFYEERDCIEHLFRVSASLDSLVLGEGQILSQLKGAYIQAYSAGCTGTIFNILFQRAISVGKKVRTNTGIANTPVSVSYTAVNLAEDSLDKPLSEATVLILGAGTMSELTATHLQAKGVKTIFVSNRTFAKAEMLAERFNGKAVKLDNFVEYAKDADILITSTGAPHYIITEKEAKKITTLRKGEPIVMIDIAVPRDIDPAVADLREVARRTPCRQMCVFVSPEQEERIMREFPECVSSRWSPLMADINMCGVTKASGMDVFLRHYGIDRSRSMAFGDGGNDVEMIRHAGVGVALGNAVDAAKRAADYVTATVDDDGVLRALQHYGVL